MADLPSMAWSCTDAKLPRVLYRKQEVLYSSWKRVDVDQGIRAGGMLALLAERSAPLEVSVCELTRRPPRAGFWGREFPSLSFARGLLVYYRRSKGWALWEVLL